MRLILLSALMLGLVLQRLWSCTYIPTSHVERITVGGTALFAPEELV